MKQTLFDTEMQSPKIQWIAFYSDRAELCLCIQSKQNPLNPTHIHTSKYSYQSKYNEKCKGWIQRVVDFVGDRDNKFSPRRTATRPAPAALCFVRGLPLAVN
jgi:hypothetical protein